MEEGEEGHGSASVAGSAIEDSEAFIKHALLLRAEVRSIVSV
jgi:hypothetical protein